MTNQYAKSVVKYNVCKSHLIVTVVIYYLRKALILKCPLIVRPNQSTTLFDAK